jgi:hypothetical protein
MIQAVDNITWLYEIKVVAQSRLIDASDSISAVAATAKVGVVVAIDGFNFHDRLFG